MLIALLGMAWLSQAAGQEQSRGALMAASDGDGGIRLIWFAPGSLTPAGWRLEEEVGKRVRVIEAQIAVTGGATDAEPAAGTKPDKNPAAGPELRALGRAFAIMRFMSDWQFAQARGVARELREVPGGSRRYRVVPLGADGAALGKALRSRPIDSRQADSLPPPVTGLRIAAVRGGAELYWQPGEAARKPPGVGWLVERDGAAVDDRPVLLGESWSAEDPAFVDTGVPLETNVRYRVAALDVFGRVGPWSEASAFIADLEALDPPQNVAAEPGRGAIRLSWRESSNAHTSGYVPERAVLSNGPYEALTGRGLRRATTDFTDELAREGVWYFYRVRAMDPRGVLGEPSLPVAARLLPAKMPKPGALRAEVGMNRVTLRWDPLPGVAGYYLQRRVAGTSGWNTLNDPITPEPRYDDEGLPSGAHFEYRVIAVGRDNRESKPGKSIAVALADTLPPGAPRILQASGARGRATLRFVPAEPAGESARFLVLRGASAEDPGVVIGEPMARGAREWTDDWVLPGETYWYRLVALDAAGNRSPAGGAVSVRIGSAPIPAPAAPRARPVSEPFAGIELRFAVPSSGFAVWIQRRDAGGAAWRTVAGPLSGERMIDSGAPAGALEYRIFYQARDGSQGPPSAAVRVDRP